MPQYWIFSGINSYDESRGQLVDYGSETLAAKGVQSNPDRYYVSALGTGRYYAGPQQVLGFQSEAKLDQEARDFASGASGLPAIAPGMFQGKRVLAMLVAPRRPRSRHGTCGLTFPSIGRLTMRCRTKGCSGQTLTTIGTSSPEGGPAST